MNFLSCFSSKKTDSDSKGNYLPEGVMPKAGFYGRSFTKLLGNGPEEKITQTICFNKAHIFKTEELVVINVTNDAAVKKPVYGRITAVNGTKEYEVAIKDPDDLPFGFQGYLHLLPPEKIGRIPVAFSESLIQLEFSH